MRLSEAIRLGSLAIQNPQAGYIQFCALGMGLEAIGKLDTRKDWQDENYETLWREWPWTRLVMSDAGDKYWEGIFLLFDTKVCRDLMTLEALCDQVHAWEDELAAKGINVEQVPMAVTPEATHEPAAEHTEKVSA